MIEWTIDHGDVRVALGDARDQLSVLPDASVQCIVTSPPFWGLRDYGTGVWKGGDEGCDHLQAKTGRESSTLGARSGGNAMSDVARESTQERQRTPYARECGRCGAVRVDNQIGLEETPEAWVDALVEVFRECRRVLRDDGVFWLEVGDTYSGAPVGSFNGGGFKDRSAETGGRDLSGVASGGVIDKSKASGVKPKDLIGAPWMLAFALRADGWYLRSDTIWERPNPMPESVTDRPTKSHSYVFLLTKKPRYFYDAEAIRQPHKHDGRKATTIASNGAGVSTHENYEGRQGAERWPGSGANARSVWTISTEATPFAHFATMPQALAEKCIKAGTSEHGACGDCGAPWERELAVERVVRTDGGGGGGSRVQEGGRGTSMAETNAYPVRTLLGWRPTCECHGQFTMVPTTEYIDGKPVVTNTRTYYEEIPLAEHPVRPCVVLDPFMGSGTTALVARRLGRHAVGTELSEEYMQIAADRLKQLSLLA